MNEVLNKKSGMLGISGVSSDGRDLEAAAETGNKRAQLALDVFDYRVIKYIGAYAAAMNGVDAIAFYRWYRREQHQDEKRCLQQPDLLRR